MTVSTASPVPLRSLLFAPGNRPRMLEKVGGCGADAVIVDLEDAVPLEEKEATRSVVRAALETYRWPRVYVRINTVSRKGAYSLPIGLEDIAAVVCPWLTGVILPKLESAEEALAADAAIASAEQAVGLEPGSIELLPLIETARGVLHTEALAGASPRTQRLGFGAGDFTTDIGVAWASDGAAYQVARSLVVMGSRAAERQPPLDTVYPEIADREGLERDARLARTLGFGGKMCIHPTQVPVVNAVFTPSAEEIDEARRCVEAFDAAARDGRASVAVDGKLVDYANAERYRRVVAAADLAARSVG